MIIKTACYLRNEALFKTFILRVCYFALIGSHSSDQVFDHFKHTKLNSYELKLNVLEGGMCWVTAGETGMRYYKSMFCSVSFYSGSSVLFCVGCQSTRLHKELNGCWNLWPRQNRTVFAEQRELTAQSL